MNRMRKGLAALAAAVFFLGVGGVAQAVIGIPDDVPGSTLLFPFFKVDPTRSGLEAQDTLLVVTNTAGPTVPAQSSVAPNIAVHVTIWSVSSVHVYDFSIVLTPHDVWSCSLYDLIVGGTGCDQASAAPLGIRDALASTVEGEDTLVGYVTADVVYAKTFLFPGQSNYPFGYGNVLIGHLYLVNLAAGSSSGYNAVSIETDNPCYGHKALPVTAQVTANSRGFYRTRCEEEQGPAACSPTGVAASCPAGGGAAFAFGDFAERIDGPNGDFAQTGTAGGFAGGVDRDSPLSLLVRYFSASSIEASSEVWLWKDRNTTAGAGALNVAVYDEEENVHSVQFSLPSEVNFASTSQIITPDSPGGWFRIKFPCGPFGSCSYNYATPPGAVPLNKTPIQAVAYGLQHASDSNAQLRWDATFPAHRQYTNYKGVSE